MSAFFAVYYGPDGLKKKALHTHYHTLVLAEGLKNSDNKVLNDTFFDTIKVKPNLSINQIKQRSESKSINLRYYDDNQHVGISLDETVKSTDINDLLDIFKCEENFDSISKRLNLNNLNSNILNNTKIKRQRSYLQQSVFNTYDFEIKLFLIIINLI